MINSKKSTMFKVACIIFLALPFFGVSQELNIDTKKASVSFIFTHDNTEGKLTNISAKITLNPQDLGKSVISGTADVNSLNTENKARDKHLKSSGFFDVETYPTMKFTSSEITRDGENYKAKGSLTIKGVKKEVSFTVKQNGSNMVFETTIYSSDFGITVKKNREKNKVEVKVTVPIS